MDNEKKWQEWDELKWDTYNDSTFADVSKASREAYKAALREAIEKLGDDHKNVNTNLQTSYVLSLVLTLLDTVTPKEP